MHGFVRSSAAAPVATLNRQGRGAAVLICEHASNYVPQGYDRLGLSAADLQTHIAWDIGALALAEQLSALLDAPLVFATHSRLLMDLNRDIAAPDSIVSESEGRLVPNNMSISQTERRWRCDWLYAPFHAAVENLIDERLAAGMATAVISVHSFTPQLRGVARPWHLGVISRRDRRLADRLLGAVSRDSNLVIGDNEPYAPEHGVYHSIERHAERRGLPGVMIEVRNDLISNCLGQTQWAGRLAQDLKASLEVFAEVAVSGIQQSTLGAAIN